jgi:hypothetical protein
MVFGLFKLEAKMKPRIRNQSPAQRVARELWATHLERWEASGLSQAEYCRLHQLDAGAFARWKKKLETAAKSGFVEMRGVNIGQPLLELTVGEDGRATLRVNFAWSGLGGERP